MEKKLTKVDMFNMVKALLADNDEVVAFCDHEIELLQKKAANKKATKNQEENVEIKGVILEQLATVDSPATVTEIQALDERLSALSNQRVSALLRQLVADGSVERTVDKKKALFSVVKGE